VSESPVSISVVVPVHNEEGNVEGLVARLNRVLDDQAESYELIFVDDGSSDATLARLTSLVVKSPQLRVLELARNYGQEAAVQAGMLAARGDWVVQIDGDLQNPPEELPKLLAQREYGFQVIYGARVDRRDPLHRVWASRLLVAFMKGILGIQLPQDVTTFRVIEGDLARFIAGLPEKRKFFSALAEWTGAKTVSVPVRHEARHSGRTKYDLFKLLNHTFDLMVGFSVRPLRLIGAFGALVAVAGIAFASYRIALKLAGAPVTMAGYTSIFSAVVILGGLHLIALSVIGEYVGRIFLELQGRPLYRLRREHAAESRRPSATIACSASRLRAETTGNDPVAEDPNAERLAS
jgi:glycosyltransferase involved in cell wall biosynthesis